MTTQGKTQTSRLRASTMAFVLVAIALAASLFATTPADAKPVERELRTEARAETPEGMDPHTWFCFIHFDAKDFAACEAGQPVEPAQVAPALTTKTRDDRNNDGPTWLCPAGTVATPFDEPIYDDDDLFVIGSETVWYCIPVDTTPAG